MLCVLSQIEPVCQEKIPMRQQARSHAPRSAPAYHEVSRLLHSVTAVTLALAFAHPSSATVSSTLQAALAEEHLHLFRPTASLVHKSIPTAVHARLCSRPISLHHWSTRTSTRQGVECPAKKLEAIVKEQQDFRIFAAHSSLGWSAGERGRFEIKEPFLECGDAVRPTTEPELKGKQVAEEECAAVSPGKAPAVIETNLLPTQKPAAKVQKRAAKAKAPAPSKTQAVGLQPWHSMASVLMVAFLVALVAMSGLAFGLVDATSLASPGGTQPALYANNATGDLDVVGCHPAIYFHPISDMADDQSSVLSAVDNLLHREAVCGELGVRCDAGGPMTEAVHANMLRPFAPGLGGFRLSDCSTAKSRP